MSSLTDAYLGLVRTDYRAYCYHVHGGRWVPGRAVSYLCDKVQEFLARQTGRPYDILIISMPPQHGKSMTITETLPSWWMCRRPDARIIEISYSEDFAQLFGRRNRDKVARYGGLFGVRLASSPNSNTEFELDGHSGGMISRGVMSGVTGRACDLMIIDDPIKSRLEADSETYRDRVWDEWVSSFKTRLAAGAKVIVIQTRWHEDDFAGRLMQTEQVEVINLPCEAESDDPLGRPVGAALCPEIGKDDAWLAQYKQSYLTESGSRAWYALFQCRPTSAAGNLIKREWWRYYDEAPEMVQEIVSVDAAFKDGADNDFVAIQVWGKRGPGCYLLDAIKAHLDFPSTLAAIRAVRARHPRALVTLIEDKANGSAAIQMLSREVPGIIPVSPEGGKVARVNAVSGAIEAGNVYLPRYAAYTADFVEECAAFPRGAHDDQVDAMSQALNRLLYYAADVEAKGEPDEDEPGYDDQVSDFLRYTG